MRVTTSLISNRLIRYIFPILSLLIIEISCLRNESKIPSPPTEFKMIKSHNEMSVDQIFEIKREEYYSFELDFLYKNNVQLRELYALAGGSAYAGFYKNNSAKDIPVPVKITISDNKGNLVLNTTIDVHGITGNRETNSGNGFIFREITSAQLKPGIYRIIVTADQPPPEFSEFEWSAGIIHHVH